MVGEKEKTNNAVNVRTRDNKIHGEISVTSAIDKLKNLKLSRTPNAEEEFWRPSWWSRLCNLVLTPENVFFLIRVSPSSENFGPTDRAPDGHSEKRDNEWVADTCNVNFPNVLRDLNGKVLFIDERNTRKWGLWDFIAESCYFRKMGFK